MPPKRAATEDLDIVVVKKPAVAVPPAENKRRLRSSQKKAQSTVPAAAAPSIPTATKSTNNAGHAGSSESDAMARALAQLDLRFPPRGDHPYFGEMLCSLKEREAAHRLMCSPLARHPGCTAPLREKHVHNIVLMANHRRLSSPLPLEVQHLSVAYMDRYLARQHPDESQLPLLTVTCLRLATKMECVQPPIKFVLDCYQGLTGHMFTPQHICAAELQVMNTLNWDLSIATSQAFLVLFLALANASEAVSAYAKYLSTLTLYDAAFSQYLPSLVACVAVSLAADVHGTTAWTPAFKEIVGYSARDAVYVDSLLRLRKLAEVLATRSIPR